MEARGVAHYDRVRVADVDDDHIEPADLLGLGNDDLTKLLLDVSVLDARMGLARTDS